MKKQTFVIPFRLPSLNEVIAQNRRNPYAGAKLKKETENDICGEIFAARLVPVEAPCIVHMVFDEPNRRRDADNVESAKKFILDALVKSGVLENDNPSHVVASPSYTRYGEGGASVTVTIIEDPNKTALRERLRRASDKLTEDDCNGDQIQTP